MPTIQIPRDELFVRLGRKYTDEEFDELCFEFGVELDDVSEHPTTKAAIYHIAVAANRTDLLCIEGLTRSLQCFLNSAEPPVYRVVEPASGPRLQMVVKASTQTIRPYVVCAVLRGVTFTPERYASFIDLQDRLHHNIARKRTLVAIGTHDLDTLEGPFSYEALPPQDIAFVPLTQEREFRGDALMEYYRTDPTARHIKPYVDIIADSPTFPVIYDAKRVVCSLPPIINGEHSKLTLATKNVFVECTATDLTKAHVVLNAVVTMFSEYAAIPFTAEAVDVVYESPFKAAGAGYCTPVLATRKATASLAVLNSTIGVNITGEEAVVLASRMQLTGRVIDNGATLEVDVPPTRPDILHECDVIEDVAIAYGYNRIPKCLPHTLTTGAQLPINKLTDALRAELARAGYDECLTLALCSREDTWGSMLMTDPGREGAVSIANPKTEEFQVGRTSMIPGLLKSLQSNRSTSVRDGLKLFEVSDVMLLDASTDTGARNERRAAALYCGPTAGFEVIHGLLDRIMLVLEIPVRPYAWATAAAVADGGLGTEKAAAAAAPLFGRGGFRYVVETEGSLPYFFPGRGARIVLESEAAAGEVKLTRTVVGTFGVLHPRVLVNYELQYPVSILELNIEHFL